MADGVSPLAEAVSNGNLSEVIRLLQAGEDPNVQDFVGETPLFEAAASGDIDIMAALMLNGADPMTRSHSEMIAEDIAEKPVVKVILQMFCGREDLDPEKVNGVYDSLSPEISRCVAQRIMELAIKQAKTKQRQSFYMSEPVGDVKGQRKQEVDTTFSQEVLHEEKTTAADEFTKPTPNGNSHSAEAVKEADASDSLESTSSPLVSEIGGEADQEPTGGVATMSEEGSLQPLVQSSPQSANDEGVLPEEVGDITTPATEQTVSVEMAMSGAVLLPAPEPPPAAAPEPVSGPASAPEPALAPDPVAAPEPAAAASLVAEPAAEPAPRSEGPRELYEVLRGPIVAMRKSPSDLGEVEARFHLGDVVELGELDASGDWRRVISIVHGVGAGTRPAEGWVPMAHPVFGVLLGLHQRDARDADRRLPALAAFAEVRRRMQPEGQATENRGHRPATQALLELFRHGRVCNPEHQRALSKLDPRTVRCVLAASLQHLRDSGVRVCAGLRGTTPGQCTCLACERVI